MLIDPRFYCGNHLAKIVKYLIVRKSQEENAFSLQPLLSDTILLEPTIVTAAVDFNGECKLAAEKIDDEMADRSLPVKIISPYLGALQTPP